jgi:hypothetical protein
MRSTAVLITVIALLSSVTGTAGETDRWFAAEQAIVRVPESAFPNLPDRDPSRAARVALLGAAARR